MKNTAIYFRAVVLIILFGLTNTHLFGQVYLKDGNEEIEKKVLKGESVTLTIEAYRGSLQWQESIDGTTWEDIAGKTENELVVEAMMEVYVRVSVSEENCDPVFSAAVHIIPLQLPTVLTGTISDISKSNAWCGGAVTEDGGDLVYSRGICWSTDSMPTIAGDRSLQGSGTGIFGNLITGLTSGTLYYIRAYATNGIGTAYGEQKQFTTEIELFPPIVTTADASLITHNSAECGGSVSSDGGDPLTTSGICWSISRKPDLDSSSFTVDGTGEGDFTSLITGLDELTKYYVRAYATNSEGTVYGSQKFFRTTKTPVLPTVLSSLITVLGVDSAVGGGEVTKDGGAPVTARGICWNTAGKPTLSNSVSIDSMGLGTYSSIMRGLDEQATYYFRAYATNMMGTSYGEEIRFATASSSWDGTFTDARDDHIYGYTTIGTQTWMAQNLAYMNSVSTPVESSSTSRHFYVYGYEGNDIQEARKTDNYHTYGVLYNWVSARSRCPAGWKLPTDSDWKILEEFLEMTEADADKTGWRFSGDVGGKLRSTDLWAPSNYQGLDSEHFTAQPGGKREVDGVFKLQTEFGYFWTRTANGTPDAWARSLWFSVGAVNRYSADRSSGFSVRCVKD